MNKVKWGRPTTNRIVVASKWCHCRHRLVHILPQGYENWEQESWATAKM